jgi:high mobility group protein B2
MGQVQHRPGQQVVQQTGKGGKPMKDPNAPKKPLSAYFLFSQEERLKVKAEFPDYSITEVAKELGRRWAQIDPAIKQSYEQRYQESRRQYEQALQAYKPQKKKKDPNAPKQPLSAYFLFSQEERLKVKEGHPNYSICEIAKELGRRWADMNPEVKQHYQQKAEEGRQKYDQEMAAYRQGNYVKPPPTGSNPSYNPSNENQAITNKSGQLSGLGLTAGTGQGLLMAAATVGSGGLDSEGLPPGVPVRVPPQQAHAQQAMFPGTDYSRLLH